MQIGCALLARQGRSQMILQEIFQSELFHFCQQDGTVIVDAWAGSEGNHHFVAQVLADGLNLPNQLLGSRMLIRVAALVPPILQNLALRKLLLEDLVRLLERVSKIGDADVENGIRRQQGKDFAFIPRTRRLDCLQFLAKLSELRKQSQFVVEVVAPADLLADGNSPNTLCCRDLITGVQNGFHTSVLDVDFSFDYGHT